MLHIWKVIFCALLCIACDIPAGRRCVVSYVTVHILAVLCV